MSPLEGLAGFPSGAWEAGKLTAGLNERALSKHMDPGSAAGKLNYIQCVTANRGFSLERTTSFI